MQPQQFVLLSSASVERWSEQLDLSLDPAALSILTEDLNFRLRQLAHDASQHMRHSGRRRIVPNDIDRALQWCNFGPSCGLGYRTSTEQTEYIQIEDMSVPVHKIIEIDNALDVRLDLDVEAVLPACRSRWALVDGRAQPGVELEYPEGQRKLDVFTSVHSEYLEQAVQAIMSDVNEATALIIDDLASNPNLSVLLPSLLNSINVGLRQYHHDLTRMFKLLGAFKALINNQFLLLTSSSSLQSCLQILNYCLRESLAIESTELADELTFRMKSAYIMKFFIETNSDSINGLEKEVTTSLMSDCLNGDIEAMFGALFTLRLLRKGRHLLKKLPALMATIEALEQQPATSAKACLARGFIQDMARIEILEAQAALLNNEKCHIDYASIELYLGPSIAEMLCPLSIGEFMYSSHPATSQESDGLSSSDQLLNSFYDDSSASVGDSKEKLRKASTSILRSQLSRRTAQNPLNVFEEFELTQPPIRRLHISYGRPLATRQANRSLGIGVGQVRANLASVLAKSRLATVKRLMLIRNRRSWSAVMKSACVGVVL